MSFAILRCIARTGALVSAVALTAWLPSAYAAVPDIPTVEGPITGPGEMQPGIRPGSGGSRIQYKGEYVSRVNQRLMGLIRDGWMLPEYAEDVRSDALGIQITPPGKR